MISCLHPGVTDLCPQGTELNDDRTPSDATVTTTFNILVIDINDNAPEFNSSEYSVAITELAQVGFALPLFIQVVDKDEVSRGHMAHADPPPIQTHHPAWAVQVLSYKIETNIVAPHSW